MTLDFTKYFKKYEELAAEADKVFKAVEESCGEAVRCRKGCADCCHALFDLTLIEALYINNAFNERFSGKERSAILDRANTADRKAYKLKRQAFKASREGAGAAEILRMMAKERVRCALLNENDECDLYDARPLTCRLYGVPTSIDGRGHTCGKSGFEPGGKYPTVRLDRIQERLFSISAELMDDIQTRFSKLCDLMVPVSMALLTEYDEDYMGIAEEKPEEAAKPAPKPEAKPAPAATIASSVEEAENEACASCNEDKSACATCKETSFSVVLGGKE